MQTFDKNMIFLLQHHLICLHLAVVCNGAYTYCFYGNCTGRSWPISNFSLTISGQ